MIRPHLSADYFPQITLERLAQIAAKQAVPLYAFDDQTALKVVSESAWQLFD